MLAVRAAQIQEAVCACDFGSHCWKRLRCFCNSWLRALGILSILIVVVVKEDEVRFLRRLLLFHLRLIEECAIEVLASGSRRKPWCLFECPREVAPGFRCDARVFCTSARACRTQCTMRRFMVLRRRSSTASFRHTDSAKNCMARCLMLCVRGCWITTSAGARGTPDEWYGSEQGGLPMDRGTIPQQHPAQEPLFSHPSAKPLNQLTHLSRVFVINKMVLDH